MAKEKKTHPSRKNYKAYLQGKEPLKSGVLQHPDESPNSIFDFMQKETESNRQTWVVPFDTWKEKQKKYRS